MIFNRIKYKLKISLTNQQSLSITIPPNWFFVFYIFDFWSWLCCSVLKDVGKGIDWLYFYKLFLDLINIITAMPKPNTQIAKIDVVIISTLFKIFEDIPDY